MHDFGTPVGSYLSNMPEMNSKGSDPYNDQQRNISFGYLTRKQPLMMLISKNKFLQPWPRSPKIKTCMNLNLGAQAPGFYLGASVAYRMSTRSQRTLLHSGRFQLKIAETHVKAFWSGYCCFCFSAG